MSEVWYRSPIEKRYLKELTQQNDVKAYFHVFLHLLLLCTTATVCFISINNSWWYFLPLAFFIHGTVFSFLGWAGASHELFHNSVFSKRKTNRFFLLLFALLCWNNKEIFSKSHARHHKFTLFPDKDQEVNPCAHHTKLTYLLSLTFNIQAFYVQFKYHCLNAIGDIRGEWVEILFPKDEPKKRQGLVKWSRSVLLFHSVLLLFFIFIGFPELILIINLGSFFGNFFPLIFASAQHKDKAINCHDFRLNSRSIKINPLFEFLYWGMNYHIEHHMYPQVPFYNLKKLNQYIKNDLPPPVAGVKNVLAIAMHNNN